MAEFIQTGWTRIRTIHGRYEYQFQGRTPAVRAGKYEDAADYQFLVMDEEGWLCKIPIKIDEAAEKNLRAEISPVPEAESPTDPVLRGAEIQLRAGLENFRPLANTPYSELDSHFAVDAARAHQLAAEIKAH